MPGQRITKEDLQNRFTYHAPTVEQGHQYVILRSKALEFASLIVELVPPGRQASLAVTAVEDAVMRANAAIAQDTPQVTMSVSGYSDPRVMHAAQQLLGDTCPECGGKNDFHRKTCSASDMPSLPTDPRPTDRSAAEE